MSVDRSKQPPIHNFENVHLTFPQPTQLSNGIPVWVIGNGEDEISRLSVFIPGGSYEEKYTLQAFFTGLLSLEANNKMSPEQVAEAFDFYGAWKSSQSYDHCTMVSLSTLNRNFHDTVQIVNDCLSHPTFPEQECQLYQQRVASNVATACQRVKYLASEEMRQLYYGKNHPLAKQTTSEGILALTTDDFRSFHRKYYHSEGCRIIIAGQVTERELLLLDKTFGAWNREGQPIDESKEYPILPSDKMLSVIDKKEALQSAICMTVRAIPRRHPDYFKLRLLVMALGGYFGSRLNSVIREEKGYTYGISASLSGRSDDAYIGINTECATQYTWPLIEEVKNQFNILKTELMPQEELDMVKQYMLGDLVKTLDTPFSLSSYVSSTFNYGIYPEYFNDQVREINACTVQDVLETAQKYLDIDKLRIVIAGDQEGIEKSRKN